MNEVAFLRMMAVNRKITSKPTTAVSHGRYTGGSQCSFTMGSKSLFLFCIFLNDHISSFFTNYIIRNNDKLKPLRKKKVK